jgi:hypothetical protein
VLCLEASSVCRGMIIWCRSQHSQIVRSVAVMSRTVRRSARSLEGEKNRRFLRKNSKIFDTCVMASTFHSHGFHRVPTASSHHNTGPSQTVSARAKNIKH